MYYLQTNLIELGTIINSWNTGEETDASIVRICLKTEHNKVIKESLNWQTNLRTCASMTNDTTQREECRLEQKEKMNCRPS